MIRPTPIIGHWYTNRSGAAFEVVAIDVDLNTIDIQFVDGTVDELDDERWAKTTVEEIETPNDCIVSPEGAADPETLTNEFVASNEWLETLDFMDIEYVDLEDQADTLNQS
ncbi:MAG: DUF6763 family protein [Pseudomonadota bacterium]